jgi:1-acyl-sn-glycerol-3-phosphate acyltransferase
MRLRDRFVLRLVAFIVPFLYEDIAVFRLPEGALPEDSPVLLVSNHFGGFADPLVLIYASPAVPRIVARDKIWRIPFAGWIMNWIGAIPVHKPKEHDGPVSNDTMFASCYEALIARLPLLIFPEGITREDPSIAPVKTGAARIALGARRAGAAGIRIVPVGIHYEDKAALRSRIFVHAGEPIDLDASIERYAPDGDATPENHRAVRALTDDIERVMRNVAPNFADWHEARTLTMAAEATLRVESANPAAPIPIADRDRLAGQLAGADGAAKDEIANATDDLRRDLDGVGLSDHEVSERMRTGTFLWFVLRTALVLLVAIPIALIGLTVNVWPLIVVWLLGFLPVGPAVKATLKPAGAILLFAIAWGIALWQSFEESLLLGLFSAVMLPLSLAALLYSSERVVRFYHSGRQWLKSRRVDALADQIVEKRRRVHDAVRRGVPG